MASVFDAGYVACIKECGRVRETQESEVKGLFGKKPREYRRRMEQAAQAAARCCAECRRRHNVEGVE